MSDTSPLISIIIVNYKVPECLREAIRSIRNAKLHDKSEIIVVDNASGDHSREMVTSEYTDIQWVQLKSNVGFGKACNVGVQHATGEFVLLLNPDTVISQNSLAQAVEFLQTHPGAGMVGPKILNPDGTLQASCRRSFPTPSVALFYFSGLSKLFPKSPRFGRYNLTFMDAEKSSEVDAISGSFMFLRKSLYRSLQGFDERFFMYGEDLDLCWRIREMGFSVWYHPSIQIVHLKGKSSAKRQFRSKVAFYEAMVIFSHKYRQFHGGFFPSWLVFGGILIQAGIGLISNLFRASTACLIDLLLINGALWASVHIRFTIGQLETPYVSSALPMLWIHLTLSVTFIFMFLYNGIYSEKSYSMSKTLFSGLFSSTIFVSLIYLTDVASFSRIAFGLSAFLCTLLCVGWREILPRITKPVSQLLFAPQNVLIAGDGEIVSVLIKNIEEQNGSTIIGILKNPDSTRHGQFEGYPVIGTIEDIQTVLETNRVDMVLMATQYPWYSLIINTLASEKIKNLSIRWVPHETFACKSSDIPAVIPLKNFSV